VDRSAANILRALVEFIPGGGLIVQALENNGVFEKVGNWVEQQIRTLGMTGGAIKQAVTQFLDSLSWSDIFNLGGVWERAKRIFTEPIDRIISFAKGLITGIITFIKDAILMPLAKLAEGTRGWDLLIAVLGKNPITGEAVPRTAETLIPGFLKLIGQEEVWENMKKANALGRAWAWFQGAMNALMGFVSQIPTLAVNAFKSLELADIILVPRAFAKVAAVFGNFIGNFITWAGTAVWNLLEIIFSVLASGVMPYIAKAKAAFRTILKDPIAFVGNLVRAAKLGFEMFATNILEHLKAALIKWITGPLGDAGVYIPKSFSLMEIIKLVLSVLGLTWQNIRSKLVKIIPEQVLAGLEKTAGILVTLVKDGPAAAWEQIKAELSELKDQLIAQVTQMITTEVVKAAVVKLVSMLNPAGAVVQAIMAIYNTVTFFIEKINQIAAVVASFIDSISAIAAGQVANAAKKVEQTMANTLTVIIAFLAKFAGAGNIPNKLVGIIKKIRQPIDKALDKIVGWLGNMLKKLFAKVFGKKDEKGASGDVREQAGKALLAQLKTERKKVEVDAIIKSVFAQFRGQGLKRLELGTKTETGEYIVLAEASPNNALLKLTPKRRKVRMTVSLKLTGSAPLLEGVTTKLGGHIRYENGERKETALPAPLKPVEGKSVMGGLLVPPEPESDELKLVTWNTGDIDPRVLSNATHAERQFTSWFESQPEKWRKRVVSIQAQINYSPCTSCAADLSRIAALAPSLPNATLTWEKPYAEGPLATTSASLASIRKWKIIPPSVSGEKEAELVAER
jgi:hypothetical protein